MLPGKSVWERMADAPAIELYGVRILCHVSFVCIVALAWTANEAEHTALKKGLLSFRVDVPAVGLGTHACMQPEAEELPKEPEPEEPPCPHSEKGK